jgi:ubiquitin-like-conjugating enzyme ATG3
MFDSFKKFIDSKFTPSDKDFEGKGMLSPEQFVQAGDQLTNFGWKWQKSLNKQNKLLPNPDKQYLFAPATSASRIRKLTEQKIVETRNGETGFTEISGEEGVEEREEDFRKYSIYISYDEYYFTPRLWIKGNDCEGRPLTSAGIFEDIYSEYQNETVTEENCPFLECRMLTIHPCKHSDVMKRFVEESKAKGKKIKPHQSLIIFLKFMSSVMPTVRYDQALDIEI